MNATQVLPTVEGLTPAILWYTLVGLVGLAALFILGHKVIEIFRKEHERKMEKEELSGEGIDDRIADKVMDKLTPQIDEKFASFELKVDKKFEEIDTKLSSDKETLTSHTTQLNDHESRVRRLESGNLSLCQGMRTLLRNIPNCEKAEQAMYNYLLTGKYNEEDWN